MGRVSNNGTLDVVANDSRISISILSSFVTANKSAARGIRREKDLFSLGISIQWREKDAMYCKISGDGLWMIRGARMKDVERTARPRESRLDQIFAIRRECISGFPKKYRLSKPIRPTRRGCYRRGRFAAGERKCNRHKKRLFVQEQLDSRGIACKAPRWNCKASRFRNPRERTRSPCIFSLIDISPVTRRG